MPVVIRRNYPSVKTLPFTHEPVVVGKQPTETYLSFFKHFGTRLAVTTQNQLRGDCPFCDCEKEDHFYADPTTGQWDCKAGGCLRSGNIYSFISQLHAISLEYTSEEQYNDLCKLRPGLDPWTCQQWGLAFSSLTDEWLYPAYSLENKMTNLYVWRTTWNAKKKREEKNVYSAPTMKQGILGAQFFDRKSKNPLWICEGHWDTPCYWNLLHYAVDKHLQPMNLSNDVIGVPGAGSFPKEYLHLLNGRDVRMLYDNDKAGRDGVDRVVRACANEGVKPTKFGVLVWPNHDDLADGYDVRDLINS